MASANDEWELSKENIQPLQQGRKPDVLKVALAAHPEDLIIQQRQAFENELRTYTGDDPLSVWYKYIKWVEQNYPKGGRDGHLHQLIQKCLLAFNKKIHYYNDKRFIEIWLKFANTSLNVTEVYDYMYNHNIGCASASFFIAWSWELEQQGNLKKADQKLIDGIQRRAEPFKKLEAYRSEFETRIASKVMAGVEQNGDQEENGRSAFSVLKVQKKKLAPVVRTGASVAESSRAFLTLSRQQPLPRNNLPSVKVPFKIFNAENVPPSLPAQSETPAVSPFILSSDTSKENEKKPSKWNKVKMKQMGSAIRSVEEANPGFKLHCDEDSQPESTPKAVPRVSNILRMRKECSSPPMADFERFDPMKRPMYDKLKVYGGGEEFSLEEIRAAAWIKRREEIEKEKKLAEQERILQEQQAQIKSLEQKMELLMKEKNPDVETYTDTYPLTPKQLQENNKHGVESCTLNQENILVGMKFEDTENVPPKDYLQEKNKRELAGILQPSKNIMFIPLEDQEAEYEEEDSEYEDDGLYKENNNHPLQDETLIPPCNTEQFVSGACLSSTPRTQMKSMKNQNSQSSEMQGPMNYEDKPNVSDFNTCNSASLQATSEDAAYCSKKVYKTDVRSSLRDQSTFPTLPGHLSVIMETSRECYKSSSSSGSSASVTKLSQFSQCYSHEKSNIQKHLSKTDIFKEPKPVLHGKDLSNNTVERDISFRAVKEHKLIHKSSTEEPFEIHCSDIDPFDEKIRNEILQSLNLAPEDYEKMHVSQKTIRTLKANDQIEIGNDTYIVSSLIAEGAYGKVYEAEQQYSFQQKFNSDNLSSKVALKTCRQANDWEYYICITLHKRLKEINSYPDVRLSVMEIISACRFSNGIALVSEFSHQGTLLDLVNFYKKQNVSIPECIVLYLSLEMLQVVTKIHECKIIHGDIKPDNILLRDNMSDFDTCDSLTQKTVMLKLIDFGRAIDLKVFKSGICFKTILSENCIEMRENKPWVFQLDWYGILNCIHILLFSEYMKVKQNTAGRWEVEKRFKRYWDQTIWIPLFDELLNIPSCYKEPNLDKFTNLIISKLRKNASSFTVHFRRLANFYEGKKL